ncbi:MAG: thioredoxin family protein [Planctomycetales bacterium]|nr:thioredoxin family protein [Planctomycetales bacterium]
MRLCDVCNRGQMVMVALLAFAGTMQVQSHAVVLQRNGIQWQTDIDQATALAQQQNKPLLMKVSTDWCGYCKKMQRETFSDATIIRHINENFVPVYVDGDKHKTLVRQLGVRSFPTTLVVTPQRKVLANITGFRSAQQLSGDLAKVTPRQTQPSAAAIVQAPQPAPVVPAEARDSIFGIHCPVSPIEAGKFQPSKPEYTVTFRGYRLSFASREYMEAFKRNPVKYWPVADGLCVVSAAQGKGQKMGDLNNGALYQGRIWFFADKESRSAFQARPAEYLAWVKQRTQAVASRPRR